MGEKTQVLILGTYHFGSCGEHLIDMEAGDITSIEKQKEIEEVIQKLLKFRPNKIAVESKRENEKKLNEVYTEYCVNGYKNNSIIDYNNEIVQLAFRIGKALNHSSIYPVDYPVNLPDNLYEYAEKNDTRFYEEFMKEINEYGKYENDFMSKNTVCEILKHLNDPDRISKEQSNLYLHVAQVGAGDTYYGVDMLTEWYRRNLYILANIQDMAEPGDRILVIYGAGHCKILRDFVTEYNKFEFVDPLSYL